MKWVLVDADPLRMTHISKAPGGILVRTETWSAADSVAVALVFVPMPDLRAREEYVKARATR